MDVKLDNEEAVSLKGGDELQVDLEESTSDIEDVTDAECVKRQFLATGAAVMLTLSSGATAGYSAIILPQLECDESPIQVDTEMKSWIASIAMIAMLVGNVASGYVMEKLGRRSSLILLTIPCFLGWTLIALGENIEMILIGRFLTGVSFGWMGPLGPIFVGEITTPKYRGFFLALLSLALAIGIFYTHLLGTLLHWKLAAMCCGVFPCAAFTILMFVPESPSWFVAKGRIEECINSFTWYRGFGLQPKQELTDMISRQKEQTKEPKQNLLNSFIYNWKKPEFRKPLFVMVPFFVITQLSGVNVFAAYTVHIIKGLSKGKSIDENISMLLVDVLRIVAMIVSGMLLRKIGRRPISMVSGSLTALCLIIMATYLYFERFGLIYSTNSVVSLTFLAFNIFISSVGLNAIPWIMIGELFPASSRGLGSGISVMMTSAFSFLTVKTALLSIESWGLDGTFMFYGLSTLLGTIFLYLCLPETMGKTLQQVEDDFNRREIRYTSDENQS